MKLPDLKCSLETTQKTTVMLTVPMGEIISANLVKRSNRRFAAKSRSRNRV